MTEDHTPDDVGAEELLELYPIESCPRCDGSEFIVDVRHDSPTFRCRRCGALWRYELGYVWSVE
jgi:hypothetical protein